MFTDRILHRVGLCAVAAALLGACANLEVVDERLMVDGASTTDFSVDDERATLSVRFNQDLDAGDSFMVEWLFPDAKTYLRKPVRRSSVATDAIETSMPIRGKAPARHPGTWRVRLSHDGATLVDHSFEIEKAVRVDDSAAEGFAGLAHCGPSRWEDPVISGRRTQSAAGLTPGAWIGTEVLESAGATYSSFVLLTGCAPG